MTNLRWLRWATARYFRHQGLNIRLASIRLGNTAIDGEVLGDGWKMALELKTPNDDIARGLGQLTEALAYGYDRAALVTTLRNAKLIDERVFVRFGIILMGIDSKGSFHQIHPHTGNIASDK